MNLNKKNLFVSCMAVCLAATMIIGGGTFAYLQDTTEDVVNNFNTNKVAVELNEASGQDYDIIPGTSETKDPTVTVDATAAAYVYVEVKDTTEGLVTYEIAEGWTELPDTPGVYYREVEGSDAKQTFPVLKDNTVSYDKTLQNSDMVDASGKLKSGKKLTFNAYAIQQEPFSDAKSAYYVKGAEPVGTFLELRDLASTSKPKTITLVNDVAYSSTDTKLQVSRTATLNLTANNTITFSAPAEETKNFAAIFVNSAKGKLTVNGDGVIDASDGAYCFHLAGTQLSKPTLTINGGTYKASTTAVNVQYGTAYINGGFFDCGGSVYTLNCIDANYPKKANIIVTGGTFVNFDPSNCASEGAGTNFVAEGYHVEQSEQENGDIWYTVVAD